MRVRLKSERSWPTRPAECHVEPQVSSPRSRRTTSVQPILVRWYPMLHPPTPPPMMTTCACVGSSGILPGLLEPVPPAGIVEGAGHAAEVQPCIAREVEIESRDARLDDAPHRLAEVGHHLHQFQAREAASCNLSEIALQEDAVFSVGELMVDGEVGQVEERIAHAGVLPVEDA